MAWEICPLVLPKTGYVHIEVSFLHDEQKSKYDQDT
jgi:hypothetical protein